MGKKKTGLITDEVRELINEVARATASMAYIDGMGGEVNYFRAMESLLFNYKKLAALVADYEAYTHVELQGRSASISSYSPSSGYTYRTEEDILDEMKRDIQNAAGWLWDQVTGFFGGIVDGIKNFLGIHSPSTVFADIGGNMAAGVGEGFGGGMDTVSADMQGAMGSAGTLTAQEAVQAVNDGIIANIGALDGAVSAIVERVTAGLTAQAARLNQIGVDMTKYIASGMTTGTPNITNIIPQIVQSIITAFTAQQPKFTAAGVDIDKAIASGMVQGTPQITAKIPQIIQSILTTINGFVSQFTAAGEEMVRGIWQGFQNMSGWLESKVRSMMREIVAAVEAEMQIASPSKVFAGIGAYMAEGLGEGFAREMQNVEKTIRRATASTVPEPQRPSGRISRNDNAARGVQVVQNIYANETSYAQQQREAAKQFRLIAREVMG